MPRKILFLFFLFFTLFSNDVKAQATTRYQIHFFLAASCPISQQYTREINRISDVYQRQFNCTIYMGHTHNRNTTKEIKKFRVTYQMRVPIKVDENNTLAKKLKATITPEVFIVDPLGIVVYQGAIDNWYYALGKNRPQATAHYLEDAIQDILADRKVSLPFTKAIGCFLEYTN